MSEKAFKIQGIVIDSRTGQGIQGLTVEAWDKDLMIDDLLGSSHTDEKGRFTIEFRESYYKEVIFDRKPDVFFRIYKGEVCIKSTEDSVLWNVEAGEVTIDISVSIERPQEQYTVKGRVKDKANNPLCDLQVKAIRRDLRKETLLGSWQTDEQGEFKISYSIPDADESGLNLALRAR